MSLPFRRRSRPRGAARLALTGDFNEDGYTVTDVLGPPAEWDGQTYEPPWRPPGERFADPRTWRDASGAATPPGVTPIAIKQAGQDTEPLARLRAQPRYRPPAAVVTGQQEPWIMTVNQPGPGVPGPTPQALEVARFLRAKVIILRRRGHLDRISDAKLRMLPGDRLRNKRTTARLIVDEAAELLRCGGEQR